ncbi:MAG: co-chaperone GroES [Patescibacteria group bacterium]
MTIKPLGDRAVLKPLTAEATTPSGIVLPDTVDQEMPEQAEVIALGDGEKIKKLGLKKGDNVIFSKYAGTDVEVEGVEHKVVSHDDILAVIS